MHGCVGLWVYGAYTYISIHPYTHTYTHTYTHIHPCTHIPVYPSLSHMQAVALLCSAQYGLKPTELWGLLAEAECDISGARAKERKQVCM